MDVFTATAVRGGLEMGLTRAQMREVIARLTRRDFYKSMTTYRDHRVWQDVYHARCQNGQIAYIKLTHTETHNSRGNSHEHETVRRVRRTGIHRVHT